MPEASTSGAADDPYGGRRPTSHEQTSGRPWDASYLDGPAPWEVGHPQPAVVRLASEGAFSGSVLDAGCGSGDNALHLASLGASVVGFDVAETALRAAREKAADQGLEVELVVADALHLEDLGRQFDAVLDCGLFHALDREERAAYVAGLAAVTKPGGAVYVLCFSDQGPNPGPHPVTQDDLRTAFGSVDDWEVVAIEPDRVQTRFHDEAGAPAWLAMVRRI